MQHLNHLLRRMAFGPRVQHWEKWSALNPAQAWKKLKEDATGPVEHYDVADDVVKGLLMGVGEIGKMERRDLDKTDKKRLRQQSREDLQNLNLLWLEDMTHSKAQLREKMAFFWHGHFASRNINILYQQQLLSVIRENALGNFGDLLRGVSKSAAMISFLNNQENKKKHPNENFAREVMELFTLGRGNYSETDIKEAARAFTGWNHRLNGEFVFRRFDHDTGEKTVLGQKGNFDGDAVLNILLEQRQTAQYITRKIYRFLVNEEHIPEERLKRLATRFYDSGYQIMALLDEIATAEWFYEPANIGAKIKSPIEWWVGIRRTLPLTLNDPESQLTLQKALGQVLFYPPNVAGWPGGRTWIDSSSLMLRLRIPTLIYAHQALDIQGKSDDDQQMGESRARQQGQLAATVDWSPLATHLSGTPDQGVLEKAIALLWAVPPGKSVKVLEQYQNTSSRDALVQSTVIHLMATPEYQLC